jgi:ribosomal protein L17
VVLTEGELSRAVRHQDFVARMIVVECDEMLKNRKWMVTQHMARDDEMAQLRARLAVKDAQLAVKDAEIKDLKDTRRDYEEQLDEVLENSDHKAQEITEGANLIMAEQFTQTQQNYADLRQYIDQIRAEHAAFVLEERRAIASTVASSQELERVLSDLSDETYMTANSTYDSSDELEPE